MKLQYQESWCKQEVQLLAWAPHPFTNLAEITHTRARCELLVFSYCWAYF